MADFRIIDAHNHLNLKAFSNDWPAVIDRAQQAGIGCIVAAVNYKTAQKAITISEAFVEGVWATVGLHPVYLTPRPFRPDPDQKSGLLQPTAEKFFPSLYEALARHPRVVAIGECGLDWTVARHPQERRLQKKALVQQLRLAGSLGLPLMIHCRQAYDDLHALLARERANRHPARGLIHFFSGTPAQAQKFIDLGFYLSFTGVVTFATDYQPAVKKVPLERLLLETDAPYATPRPYRGQRNEPAYIIHTLKVIAGLKGVTESRLANITRQNTVRLFRIKI